MARKLKESEQQLADCRKIYEDKITSLEKAREELLLKLKDAETKKYT